MTTTMKRLTSVCGAMFASALLFVALATPGRAATEPVKSVDALAAADGLVLIPDSTMAQAWVKPGAMHRSNRAWNQAEVRRGAERFGVSVRKQVEEFTKL